MPVDKIDSARNMSMRIAGIMTRLGYVKRRDTGRRAGLLTTSAADSAAQAATHGAWRRRQRRGRRLAALIPMRAFHIPQDQPSGAARPHPLAVTTRDGRFGRLDGGEPSNLDQPHPTRLDGQVGRPQTRAGIGFSGNPSNLPTSFAISPHVCVGVCARGRVQVCAPARPRPCA